MKKFIYTFLFISFFSVYSIPCFADHLVGSDFSYTCTNTPGTWHIKLTIYRDCSGIPLGNCIGACGSGSTCGYTVNWASIDSSYITGSFNVSLTSVTDVNVNPLCASSKNICTNMGCTVPGSYSPGVEKYLFEGDVKLDSTVLPSTCCNVRIFWHECCRNSTISTGSAGQNFYVEAIINRCAAANNPCNNSPELSNDPFQVICGGQPFVYNYGAIDPDHDSLTFAFAPALIEHNSSVTYNSPYSYDNPMPHPPPVGLLSGISCNANTGDIIFTPSYGAGGQFVGVMAIEIKQWRRINNVTTCVGVTRRDVQLWLITCSNNHPPSILTSPSNGIHPILNWKVNAGNTLCFNVIAKDTDYLPTNTPPIIDSTYLSWDNSLASKGATFVPTYNVANRNTSGPREDNYQFCWTPDSTMVSNTPWMFTSTAIDNRCPNAGKISRAFLITVVGSPNATIIKNNRPCYKWDLSYVSPHLEYITSQQWQVSNTSGAFNSSNYRVSNSSTASGFSFNDTGKYVVKLILHGDVSTGAITEIYDTVYNTSSFRLTPLADTTVCPGSVNYLKLKANHSGGKSPLTTIWFDPIQNTILSTNDSILVPLNVTKNYAYYVTDSSNCTLSDYSTITVRNWPVNTPSINPTICEGSSYTFDAGDNNGNIKSYKWNIGDTTKTITTNIQKSYSVRIIDTFDCYNNNSFYLFLNPIPKTNAGIDTTICKGKSIQLQASGANLYQWNLLSDSTVISNTNSLNVMPDSSTSYRILGIDTMNSVSCYNADTIKVIVNPRPAIPSISGPSTVTINQATIFSAANHSGNSYNWFLSSGTINSGQGTNAVNAVFASLGSGQINVSESQNNCWSDTASKSVTVNAVGGINEKNSFENLNIFPNPTSGILNIEFETSDKMIVLEVYDILGRPFLKSTLQHTGGLFQHAVNISVMNKGIYFLKIIAEGKTVTIKVTLK